MATVASGVPFHNFCLMLEKIKKLPGTDAKKKILKEFIDEWRSCHNRIHKDDMKTTVIIFSLSLSLGWDSRIFLHFDSIIRKGLVG